MIASPSVVFDLPLRLPGRHFDAETGLHYNYFRDYDPSLGKYGESDLIGLNGGLNTYVYGLAVPITNKDPRGLDVYLCTRPIDVAWSAGNTFSRTWWNLRMTLSNLVLAIAILLNLLYVGMAFAAFGHVKNEKRDVRGVNRLLALTVWWPFYDELYDEGFARMSLMGKLLLPLVLGSYALYFFGSSILDI